VTTDSGAAATRAEARAATRAAARAADAGAVEVREVHHLADLHEMLALYRDIWGESPVNLEQLRAMTHAGNYAAAAYRGGTMVGACVGFFAAPPGESMHSHVAGVTAGARAANVGFALKLHQRAWAMARGIREITWTFDPLVRRNAHVNLVKLAARPREYLVDFYGDLADAVNAGQGSDRLLAAWDLADAAVVAACDGTPARMEVAGAAPALRVGPDGAPQPVRATAGRVLVGVPEDVEAVRRRDPGLARRWRSAVRDVLGGLMAQGARVVGFVDGSAGGYLVEQWSPRKLSREEDEAS
jgi:predicted GNAT superfamily acetyltransferase